MKKFSEKFETFKEWAAQARPSSYREKIKRSHGLRPKATLSELRRHPKPSEKTLSEIEKIPIHRVGWDYLSPLKLDLRTRALRGLSLARRKKLPLSRVAKSAEVNLLPETVLRNTGAFKKIKAKWVPKRHDTISRVLAINEEGEEKYIHVKDSRHSTTIGKYFASVKKFLESGNPAFLKPFRRKKIKDAGGNWHTLETDPSAIYEIQERREEEEFYSIYAD